MTVLAEGPIHQLLQHIHLGSNRVAEVWKWLSSRSVVIAGIAATCLVCCAGSVIMGDKIIIGPFTVPKDYEERGYTAEAISNSIVQFIRGNESTVSLAQPNAAMELDRSGIGDDVPTLDEIDDLMPDVGGKHVVSSFDQSTIPDIKVPLTSVSLESLIDSLRFAIGHKPTVVAGEIVAIQEAETGSAPASTDPQHTSVLIRYKVEYPEPARSILGYHWWSRRVTTISGTLRANGAEEVIRKLALVTADGLGRRTLVHETDDERARRLVGRGNAYFGLNDYSTAARMYESANNVLCKARHHEGHCDDYDDGDPHALLALGVISEQEGDYEGAKESYKRALKVPDDGDADDIDGAWAQLYLGNLELRNRHLTEALSDYAAVAGRPGDRRPKLPQAYAAASLGFVAAQRKHFAEAESSFKTAKKFASDTREAARTCVYEDSENLACVNAGYGEDRAAAKARASLDIKLANEVLARTYFGLAETSLKGSEEQTRTGEGHYREAIQANPFYAPAHYRLACLYSQRHKYKRAIDEFQNTIQADPSFESAYKQWKALIDRWNSLEGKQKSDRAFTLTLAQDYKNWGDVLKRGGNPDDALDRYCVAATLDSNFKSLCNSR